MNVIYLGGRQAGCVGLLTVKALGHNVMGVLAYDDLVKTLTYQLGLRPLKFLSECWNFISFNDIIIVSVHAKDIIPKELLDAMPYGGINAHPYLYAYKGISPVKQALAEGNFRASVGVHRMIEKVDCGEVLSEVFVDVSGQTTEEGIYNMLYPYYSIALIQAMAKLVEGKRP